MKTRIAVFLGIGVLVLLSACARRPLDYYPLEEGYTWTYQDAGSEKFRTVENFAPRKMDDQRVVPQKITSGESVSFLFAGRDRDGIYEYAFQDAGDAEPSPREEREWILKGPLKKDAAWEGETSLTLLMENIPYRISYTVESLEETVTVPAGTFENCLKVRGRAVVKRERGVLGTLKVEVVHDRWFAPGTGLVKSLRKESGDHVLSTSREKLLQLTAFRKPGA